MRRLNLCRIDRIVRAVAGVVLAGVAVFALRGALAVGAGIAAALLVLSASTGFCHVYKVCGIDTRAHEGEDAHGNR